MSETEIIGDLATAVGQLVIYSLNVPAGLAVGLSGVLVGIGRLWGSGVERRRNRKAARLSEAEESIGVQPEEEGV